MLPGAPSLMAARAHRARARRRGLLSPAIVSSAGRARRPIVCKATQALYRVDRFGLRNALAAPAGAW